MQSVFRTSSADPHSCTSRVGPPWRILAALAAAVLLVHVLLLQMPPARIGPESVPASKSVAAFATRSIALPPAPAEIVTPPAQPAQPAPPVATLRKTPVLKKKRPVAQSIPAQAAPESIAEKMPESRSDDASTSDTATSMAPPSNESEDSAAPEAEPATPTEADTAIAAAAVAPASAAPAPVLDAGQTPVTAMALPASVQLDYKMTGSAKGLTYHANGELIWENAGSSYNASMTVKALFIGARTMRSTGQVSDQGLAPTRFSDKSRSEVAAHFEPEKGQISFSANTPTLPWTQGAQDRVSVFIQLGGMMAGNPAAFPVGAIISMRTVGPRDADMWPFLVESEESLKLPFGNLETLKLSRKPRHEYDQKLEVWYAPALGFLPVRNKITQANGDFVDQELKALTRP